MNQIKSKLTTIAQLVFITNPNTRKNSVSKIIKIITKQINCKENEEWIGLPGEKPASRGLGLCKSIKGSIKIHGSEYSTIKIRSLSLTQKKIPAIKLSIESHFQ